MKVMSKCMGRILAAAVLAAALYGCSGQTNMVGTTPVKESTEGMTKLEGSQLSRFTNAVNKKYNSDIIKDCSLSLEAEVTFKPMPGESENGDEEIKGIVSGDLKYCKDTNTMFMDLNMDYHSDDYSFRSKAESYTDFEKEEQYNRLINPGQPEDWEKTPLKTDDPEAKTDDSEVNIKSVLFLEEDVSELYQDPDTESYAAYLKIDSDEITESLLSGIIDNSETQFADKKPDDLEILLSVDKDYSISGLYIEDASELFNISSDSSPFSKADVRGKLDKVNTGIYISIPEKARAAEKAGEEKNFLSQSTETMESKPEEKKTGKESDTAEKDQADKKSENTEEGSRETKDDTAEQKTEKDKKSETSESAKQYLKGDEIPVYLNGVKIEFGKITLQEALNLTGSKLMNESDKLNVVNKNDTEWAQLETENDMIDLDIWVENQGNTTFKKKTDCRVCGVSYDVYSDDINQEDDTVKVDDIMIGTSMDKVLAFLGEAYYVSDDRTMYSFDLEKYSIDIFTTSDGAKVRGISITDHYYWDL